MAQYHHLNIYKTAFDMLVYFAGLFTNFAREYKYTLAEQIMNNMIVFIVKIYSANNEKRSKERLDILYYMMEVLQTINVMLRLSMELRNLPEKKYNHLANFTDNLEKQLSGWINFTLKKLEEENESEKNKSEI